MKSIFNTKGNLAEVATYDNVMKVQEVSLKKSQDNSLIILNELGYDTGKFSHIKVSSGLVDVRTLTSEIDNRDENQNKTRYQRTLYNDRLNEIVNNPHVSKRDEIVISLRDSKRYVVDGQARTAAYEILFDKKIVDTPMIPCRILQFATYEDECILFAEQDDGKTALAEKQRTNAKIEGKDVAITYFNRMVEKHGMSLRSGRNSIGGHVTLKNYFLKCWKSKDKDVLLDRLDRILFVISSAFENGEVHNATSGEMINGLICFYSNFSDDIDDKSFIKKLHLTTPDKILQDFKSYHSSSDKNRKYLKALVMLYNKSRKINRIDYD